MSNILKCSYIFAIVLFIIITFNCSGNNPEIPPQIAAEENSICQKPQQTDIDSKNEMMRIWQKERSKDERKKLKEELKQAKKERKDAKSSQLIYYIVETLPFACLVIAPTIASFPFLNQALNKFSQISTKIKPQNSSNNNKEMDLTSHLLCQTIAKLLNMYVEKQVLTEKFHQGRVKALKDRLEEKKKEKKEQANKIKS